MISKLKKIFSKNNSVSFIESDKRLDVRKEDIYNFFIKSGIDSEQRGCEICKYFGIDTTHEYLKSQEFLKEFSHGENKILIINPGYDEMSAHYHENIYALTKESKRDIKLKEILK